MQTTTMVHLNEKAQVEIAIRNRADGSPYISLTISDGHIGSESITLFPEGPEFLDKLANACDAAVREYVGDVPPAHLEPLPPAAPRPLDLVEMTNIMLSRMAGAR